MMKIKMQELKGYLWEMLFVCLFMVVLYAVAVLGSLIWG